MSENTFIEAKNTKMKVLLIGDYFPDIGGVTFYVHKLLLRLTKYGLKVILLHTKTGKPIRLNDNIHITRIPSSNEERFKVLLAGLKLAPAIFYNAPFLLLKPNLFITSLILSGLIQDIILKEKPYIIHSNHLSMRTLIASIIGEKFNIPVIVTCHGYDTEVPPTLYEYLIRRSVIVHADKLIVLTNAKKQLLSKIYDEAQKLIVIPNFIRCEDVLYLGSQIELEKRKVMAKKRAGIPPNKVVLLYLGRIVKEKGVFDIVNAIKEIRESNPELYNQLEVIIAGDGPAVNRLKFLLDDLRLENLRFIDKVSESVKRDLFLLSDVFLLPTTWHEAFPTAVLEAYKYGTPVVSYYFRGIKDIILHRITGLIILKRDYRELTKMIIEIVSNRSKIYEMGLNALKFVRKFCAEHVVAKIVKLYIYELSERGLKRESCSMS